LLLASLNHDTINTCMNEFHTALSLPKNVFNVNTSVHSFPLTRRTILNPNLHLNLDVVKIINDAGLRIIQSELFYSPPDMVSGIHRDTPGSDISKINWIYQGSNSVMCWYDTDPNKIIEGRPGNTNKLYSLDESTLIHKSEICSPSIIQAGVAHNVINSSEPRWAVSLMLCYRIKQCPYYEAVERLKEYVLLE